MFTKVKAGQQRQQMIELLKFVVTGTQSPHGFALVPKELAERMAKYEPTLVKVRDGDPDVTGQVQVFATSLGVAAVTGAAPATEGTAPAAEAAKPVYAIESGFEIPPPSKRGGGGLREETYPFSKLEIGQSFFIPATETNTDPAKAIGSTITSANRRFLAVYPMTVGKEKKPHPKAGQPTGKDGRKFRVVARTTAHGEKQNGARIYRVS